jgi:hypothetical protein
MWTSDIQASVFTRIKAEGTKKLKTKYPNINFTTSSKQLSEPKFPTVYVKRMQGSEQGSTLDGKTVNAILSTFQIEVTDNSSDTVSQYVADVIYEIMKSMCYQALGEPFADNSGDTYRNVARYQRIVGYNDIL